MYIGGEIKKSIRRIGLEVYMGGEKVIRQEDNRNTFLLLASKDCNRWFGVSQLMKSIFSVMIRLPQTGAAIFL